MISGFLALAKPKGPTSAAIVGRVRNLLHIKKIGHTGTLDPLATGVLVLALHQATAFIQYLPTEKTYHAVIRLGVTTSTLDSGGVVVERRPIPRLSLAGIEEVLAQFVGCIDQIPPMVSACHMNGKRLYQLARQGLTVERRPRPVTIMSLKLLEYRSPDIVVDVACSAGTYIRALADDIGRELGCGAHLAALTRTRTSGIELNQCVTLEELASTAEQQNWTKYIILPSMALAHLPVWYVPRPLESAVGHGQPILMNDLVEKKETRIGLGPPEHVALIKNHQEQLLGLGYRSGDYLKMKRVLNVL